MNNSRTWLYVWFGALALEGLLIGWMHNVAGPYVSPFLLLLSGLVVAGIPLVVPQSLLLPVAWHQPVATRWSRLIGLGLVMQAAAAALWLAQYLEAHPVQVASSDVIPQIQVLLRRFWAGEPVYAPITEWGYTLNPTYLTWHWLVFSPAYAFDWDFRAYALTAAALVWVYLAIRSWREIRGWPGRVVAALPWFMLWSFIAKHSSDLALTIEPLPACWYLLLVLVPAAGSSITRAAWAGLCLLSRYALVLWMPVWLLLELVYRGWRRTLLPVALIALLVSGGYVVPFLLRDPGSFARGLAYHRQAALGEWKPHSWQAPTDPPYHLYRGLGFAAWFHSTDESKHEARLSSLQRVHLALCLLAAASALAWVSLRRKRLPLDLALAASLKLYLVFFYLFIQIPYSYLFWVPCLMSVGLVFVVFRRSADATGHQPASQEGANHPAVS